MKQSTVLRCAPSWLPAIDRKTSGAPYGLAGRLKRAAPTIASRAMELGKQEHRGEAEALE